HCRILVIVSLPQGRCIIFPREQGCIQILYQMDMYVSALIMIEENTPLPIPIEGECHVINDAIGTLVLWPIELVVLEKTVANSLKNKTNMGNQCGNVLPEMLMFYKCIMKMDCSEQIIVPIDIGVTTQSKTVHVGKEELLQFLAQEQIGVCHILIYMTKMYEIASVTGVSSLFGFLCPSRVSLMTQSQKGDVKKVKENRRNRSRYLVDVFKENGSKGKVFFAPYNAGFHWILCVIDPYNNIVYYLDSLHNQEDIATRKGISEDLREIVDIALFQFRSEIKITRKLKMDTKWITIQEIISHKRTKIPET
ncbi:Phosphoribosylaminoimidazole-succinocarboxamide synthase chloroplastic, partial [Bienertia sinuspersici]